MFGGTVRLSEFGMGAIVSSSRGFSGSLDQLPSYCTYVSLGTHILGNPPCIHPLILSPFEGMTIHVILI